MLAFLEWYFLDNVCFAVGFGLLVVAPIVFTANYIEHPPPPPEDAYREFMFLWKLSSALTVLFGEIAPYLPFWDVRGLDFWHYLVLIPLGYISARFSAQYVAQL